MGTTEDKIEIYELISRYAHTVDAEDEAAWADVFTDDGIFSYRLRDGTDHFYQGREQLIALATKMFSAHGETAFRHNQLCPLILELSGDRAIVRAYSLESRLSREPGAAHFINTTGIYYDEIVRTPKGWRFKVRHHIADPQPQP